MISRALSVLAFCLLAGPAAAAPAEVAAAEPTFRIRCPGPDPEEARLFVERPPYNRSRARYLLAGTPPGVAEPPVAFTGESCAFEYEPTGEPDQRLIALCGELRFELDLTGPRAGEPGDLPVPALGRLAGRVEGKGGTPIAGAIVYLEKDEFPQIAPWRLGPLRAVAGDDGGFALPYYPGSRVVALAPGFTPGRWRIDTLAAAPAAFVLQPAERRRITVFRSPGKREPGVLVETADHLPLGFTGGQGQLEVAAAPGDDLVFTSASGWERWHVTAPRWQGGELETAVGGRIFTRGRILGADGEPVAGARVLLRQPDLTGMTYGSATAGADGFFALGPVEPASFGRSWATWTLVFAAPGHAGQRLDWSPEPGSWLVTIPDQQLAAAARITGRVVDEEGRGVAGAKIFEWSPREAAARDGELEPPSEAPQAESGGDGELALSGIAAGEEVVLEVQAQGFLPRLEEGIHGGDEGVEITLERGSVVEVVVVDESGQRVPEAWVGLDAAGKPKLPRRAPTEFRGSTGADGVASLPPVARGEFTLRVWGSGLVSTERKLVVDRAEMRAVVRVSRGAIVEGLVLEEDGQPAAGARIGLESDTLETNDQADENGFYRVAGLDPGPVTLTATSRSGGVAEGTTEIAAGRVARLDLRVSRRLLELRGVLLDAAGKPVASHQVYLETRDETADGTAFGVTSSATTAADGSFRFEIAHARNYVLTAARAGDELVDERMAELEVEMTHSQSVVMMLPP